MARVVITIGRDGKVKREAFDFTGQSCKTRTAFLDSVLGQPTEEVLKDEYYQDEVGEYLPSGWCG